jgi:peptidyl-prolyl cis-trans isomerase B (cyclophilin B)
MLSLTVQHTPFHRTPARDIGASQRRRLSMSSSGRSRELLGACCASRGDDALTRRGMHLAGLSLGMMLSVDILGGDKVLAEESSRAYFDFTVDGAPFGRIVIETLGKNKIGEQRFLDLAKGVQGVGYRRDKITQLQENYIVGGGLKSLSYEANGRTGITGGPTAELLEEELSSSTLKHDAAGLVSLNVLPMKDLQSKEKLTAIDGKFVTVSQTFGLRPNGTEIFITTGPASNLDETNLLVGRVVSGMDVVERLQKLPRVKNNTNSPFFQAGKKAGDLRANVAELAFDRPFSKVIISNCGLLQ